jgi:hypothetical protein
VAQDVLHRHLAAREPFKKRAGTGRTVPKTREIYGYPMQSSIGVFLYNGILSEVTPSINGIATELLYT